MIAVGARLHGRVKRARWRREGDRSVLAGAVVVTEPGTAIDVEEIRGPAGEPTTYRVQRYSADSPAGAGATDLREDWGLDGDAEVWDEARVRELLTGAGPPVEPFRIAIRTEDLFVVAYLARPDTMAGATKIATVHRAFFDLVEGAFERFKADVATFSREVLAMTAEIPVEEILTREREPPADA